MYLRWNAGEVSNFSDCVPTRDVTQAELRALEATHSRSRGANDQILNSESTLLDGEDDSLNPILSVEPFHRLLDVPIDGSV